MRRYSCILALSVLFAHAEQPIAPATSPDHFEIVLFSEFQCPFCRQFAGPIRELMAKGVDGAQTKVAFKQFPLSFHHDAQLAAQAALAAKGQGKFWEMHDLI